MFSLIQKDLWKFQIDVDITADYYKSYTDLCDCAPCRNYYQAIKDYSADLTAFLEQFGIDIEKPIETCWYDADKQANTVDYTAYYAFHGFIESGEYEIDFDGINVVVQNPENMPNTEITKPYYIFQIFNLYLPWVISEYIKQAFPDIIPKRNIFQRIKARFTHSNNEKN